MNLWTLSVDVAGSSVERPTISTPRGRNCLCSLTSAGVSDRQGPHQLAQRLISNTLPEKSASLNEAPLAAFSSTPKTCFGNADNAVAGGPGAVDLTVSCGALD